MAVDPFAELGNWLANVSSPVKETSLECEITGRKVRGSNPTAASRLLLSKLEQPGSVPAVMPPIVGVAARQRNGATTERLLLLFISATSLGTLILVIYLKL
ncbi:hypothetical protein T265_00850 [Opisthorchis viverrini]|uniref:Uncharacterized protein n=1 Tax=Opisthorchis viverrini TaxID=6198 RepID=A0A075A4G9_OPIVI|nr:hypothetical protein T265_00850 [Opisthorchis viverrini]KER33147.1 hypothetical protein T265_00850 [Opisthorchis viverrini]